MALHTASVNHMLHVSDDGYDYTEHPSVEQYYEDTWMYTDGTWATTNDIMAVAHLLRTCLFSYSMEDATWHRFSYTSKILMSIMPLMFQICACTFGTPTIILTLYL